MAKYESPEASQLTNDLDLEHARRMLEKASRDLRWLEQWADCQKGRRTVGEVQGRMDAAYESIANATSKLDNVHVG